MHGSTGIPIPVTTFGGLITLANPETVPEGASPRLYDMDFNVGDTETRAGLTNQYPTVNETVGPNPPTRATSATWVNPNNIRGGSSYTTQSPVGNLAHPLILGAGTAGNSIDITEFTFDISLTSGISGVLLELIGYANAPVSLQATLLIGGVPKGLTKTISLPLAPVAIPIGGTMDSWGLALTAAQLNNTTFGVRLSAVSLLFPMATAYLRSASLSIGISTGSANYQFVQTFVAQNGTTKNLFLDAQGNFYVENVTTHPGTQVLTTEGITPNSYMVGVNGPDVEYLAVTNLRSGADQPMQYTANWIDRITQVGPGAAPSFSPAAAAPPSGTPNTFAISSIAQPPPNSDITDPGNLSVLLWSAGPTSTAPGNVLTVFYSPSFFGGSPQPEAQDTLLVNSFNSGQAVYVYISGTPFGAGTYLVTSVGNALPPGVDHERYYFTVSMTTSSYQNVVEASGQYQMTVATMIMAVPVPGMGVGNDATITGAGVAAWDATWPISATINSATMAITNTQVTASVATYTYSVVSLGGSPPTAGQLVTITNTTNANGALNGTNLTIVS